MATTESSEMYLETLLVLKKEKNHVRAIDIAEHMGFSKPAVSRALVRLRADGLLTVDGDGYLDFTDAGLAIADKIYERHLFLTAFLCRLGVDEATAVADACRMEHVISDASLAAIKAHVEQYGK